MTPTVEGVEHAHPGGFIGSRTGLYHGTYDHFQDSSAYGVEDHTDQDSRVGIHDKRKIIKTGKTDDGYQKRTEGRFPVSGAFDHFRGYKVHQDLDTEINGDQKTDLVQ